MNRRHFILATLSLPWGLAAGANPSGESRTSSPQAEFEALEKSSGGRLGVCAIDTGSGKRLVHRADERFPLCSTFKLVLAGAVMARSSKDKGLMSKRIHYRQADLIGYSPVSRQNVAEGMTIAELCKAAIQYSDNAASNLLLRLLGGPAALTAFARSLGDRDFRLDRYEIELNSALPGDPRDTSTPAGMAQCLSALTLGDALPPDRKREINAWLLDSKTGDKRIRAGVPSGWRVGDKTGSGDYGSTNDIGILWPPQQKPIILAVYYTQEHVDAKWRDDVIAATARIVSQALAL